MKKFPDDKKRLDCLEGDALQQSDRSEFQELVVFMSHMYDVKKSLCLVLSNFSRKIVGSGRENTNTLIGYLGSDILEKPDTIQSTNDNKHAEITRALDGGFYSVVGDLVSRHVNGLLQRVGMTAFPEIKNGNSEVSNLIMKACQNLESLNFEGSNIVNNLRRKLDLVAQVVGSQVTDSNFIISEMRDNGEFEIRLYSGSVHHNQYEGYQLCYDIDEIRFLEKYLAGTLGVGDIWEVWEIRDIIGASNPRYKANILKIDSEDDFELEEADGKIFIKIQYYQSTIGEKGTQVRKEITRDILDELQNS